MPRNTEFERFDNAVRKMFTVSKKELLKEEARWNRNRAKAGKSRRSRKKAV